MLGLLCSCTSSKTSLIIGDHYDEETDITTLIIMPYGNILIPGKWTKTSYYEDSRQHIFKNADSVHIAVTKAPQEKYSFYEEGISDGQFAEKFYEWEKEYFEEQGYTVELLQNDAGFIVWRAVIGDENTILLFGAKNPYAFNLAVFSDIWPDEKRIEFLENIFKNN